MTTWMLYILMLSNDGQWLAMEGRTYAQPNKCEATAAALKGRPVGGGVVYSAICKEKIDV